MYKKLGRCFYLVYICTIIKNKAMKKISDKTKANIEAFARDWANGNIIGCKESSRAASRYLDMGPDWIYQNMGEWVYSNIVGCIEWTNFNGRLNFSVKKWRL